MSLSGLFTFSRAKAFCLQLILFLVAGYLFLFQPLGAPLADFDVFLAAAEQLAKGLNPYEQLYRVTAFDGREFDLPYLYPPFLAAALSGLLSLVSAETLKLVFCTLSFISFFLSLALIRKCFPSTESVFSTEWFPTILLFIAVCFQPFYWGYMYGQVDAFVLLLLLLMYSAKICGQAALAGALLTAAACLKVTPALFFLWLLRNDCKRVVLGSLLALSLLVALLFSLAPTESLLWFAQSLGSDAGTAALTGYEFNFSLLSIIAGDLAAESRTLASVLWGLLIVALAVQVRGRGDDAQAQFKEFAAFLSLMFLLSPIIWFQHFIWLLPLLLTLFLAQPENDDERYRVLTLGFGIFLVFTEYVLVHYHVLLYAPALLLFSQATPGIAVLALLMVMLRSESRR